MVASWFAAAAGLETDESFSQKVSGVDSTGQFQAMRGVHDLAERHRTEALRLPGMGRVSL